MRMAGQNDEMELLSPVQAGDRQTYSGRIFGNILKMANAADTAQDLLQQVFVKVWEKRDTIDQDLSFRSYLFQISKNMVFNFLRHANIERQVKSYLTSVTVTAQQDIEPWLDGKEQAARLEQLIGQLPSQRKAIFTLCKLEGKTYEEVATQLGISTSTISDHIVKVSRFLKEQLRKEQTAWILAATLLKFT